MPVDRTPRVYTVTPNPALDVSGMVHDLLSNEKNYVFDERRDPGGNGVNASRMCQRLGARTMALGFVGGTSGDEYVELLAREKVPSDFTRIRGRTRTNVTATNERTHQQTRLTFPGPRVTAAELRALLARIRRIGPGSLLVLGGSLPSGCPEDFHVRFAREGARRGLGVVVDVPAKVLRPVLGHAGFRALLVKPNQAELEELTGARFKSDEEMARAAVELTRHAALVCVSLAERGAILATRAGAWFGVSPHVEAKGTVGAGDSMVGAMCSRLLLAGLTSPEAVDRALEAEPGALPRALEDTLRWGLAAGAATAETVGTGLGRPEEVRRLVELTKVVPLALGKPRRVAGARGGKA